MSGLLEYSKKLKDWEIDEQIAIIYWRMVEILKHHFDESELSRLECEVINDCMSMGAGEKDDNSQYPYAWLMEPCHDEENHQISTMWWHVIARGGLGRFGNDATLERRKKWHFNSACAACIVIVSYVEGVQSGKIRRDDFLTLAVTMKLLAFIVADVAFLGSSTSAITKQRETRKKSKAAKDAAAESFKAKFKKEKVFPAWRELLNKGIKRGDKAKFVREMINEYDLEAKRAQRNGLALSEKNQFIVEARILAWIKEIEPE